jgi:putative heme-binding domain-containing protein
MTCSYAIHHSRQLIALFLITISSLVFYSPVQGWQGSKEETISIPRRPEPIGDVLSAGTGERFSLHAFAKVPTGWTEAAGPSVVTQSISLLIPDTFPSGDWWVNGKKLGTPIRTSTENSATDQSQGIVFHRIAIPFGTLKSDQLVDIHVELIGDDVSKIKQISAPSIASYNEEISLSGTWLITDLSKFDLSQRISAPEGYKFFDKTEPGSSPLAAPTQLQPTRHLSPDESLKAITVTEGLKVEQVLTEPTIGQPLAMAFDTNGRLWVVEYRQYPYPAGMKIVSRDKFYRAVYDIFPAPPPDGPRGKDRISVHEDSDGDGKFDRHEIFQDGLNIASSVLPVEGGAWVLNPPYLLFYEDRDGDLHADGSPQVHLTGFGMEDTHSVANSLRLGPDGWIYGAMGSTVSSSIKVTGLDQPPLQCEGSAIWRYHPQTKRYEIFAEGGGNAFCVAFDADGNLFSGHNGNDTRGFHYWQGAYYRKDEFKHGVVSNPYAYGNLGYMIHPPTPRFSHALLRYGDTALPSRFHNQLLAVDPLKGTVVLSDMKPQGGTFATNDLENTLSTKDFAFRPIDIQVGPDGSLYVADFCEEYIAHGQHYLGMLNPETGRIYRIKPTTPAPASALLTNQQIEALQISKVADLLSHPAMSIRELARKRILRYKKDAADYPNIVHGLKDNLRHSEGHEALESLWILQQQDQLSSDDWQVALHHKQPYVRLWSIRLLGDWPNEGREYDSEIIKLSASEQDPIVLCQLACTAKRLPAPSAIAITEQLAKKKSMATEINFPLLLWWAVEPHMITGREHVMRWLEKPEVWDSPFLTEQVGERIVRRLVSSPNRADASDAAKLMNAAYTFSPMSTRGPLRGFDQAITNRQSLDLPEELVKIVLRSGGGSLNLRLRLHDPDALKEALTKLQNTETANAEKKVLIQTLGLVREKSAEDILFSYLGSKQPTDLQIESLYAIELISAPEKWIGLIAQYPSYPIEVQEALVRVLARHRSSAATLLASIDSKQIPGGVLTTELRDVIAAHGDSELSKQLDELAPIKTAMSDEVVRQELARWSQSLNSSGGNPYEGKVLFAEHCGKCHKLFNEGGEVGPDLTRYNRDDRATLLLSILRPSQEIREGYQTFQVLTSDGRVVTGFIVDQNDEVVTIRESAGQSVTIAKDEIDEMKATPRSVMPEGLLDKLTEAQVRHLFAYLQSGQPLGR